MAPAPKSNTKRPRDVSPEAAPSSLKKVKVEPVSDKVPPPESEEEEDSTATSDDEGDGDTTMVSASRTGVRVVDDPVTAVATGVTGASAVVVPDAMKDAATIASLNKLAKDLTSAQLEEIAGYVRCALNFDQGVGKLDSRFFGSAIGVQIHLDNDTSLSFAMEKAKKPKPSAKSAAASDPSGQPKKGRKPARANGKKGGRAEDIAELKRIEASLAEVMARVEA